MAHIRTTIAGQDVLDEIAANKARTVLSSAARPGCLDSESLCAHQRRMAQRGFLGAEIVKSNYGYSLRYDSGLQDFGLIASARARQVDGSFDDAVRYATRWQAQDQSRRYVTYAQEA